MPGSTARALVLLELLQTGALRTTPELADRLDVDQRTVRRDVDRLQELGVPVEAVRGRFGGYRIGAGARLPPLMLTDEEALAVMTALARADGDPAAETAEAKIRRVLPVRLAERLGALLAVARVQPLPGADTSADVVLTVGQAAADRRPVRIRYRDREGAETERTVLPWGLVLRGGRWYLSGPDSGSGELRTFRLDRIAAVEPGAGRFDVPAGFDAGRHLDASLARAPRAHDVSVVVAADPEAVRRRFPAGFAVLGDAVDGRTRIRVQSDDLPRLAGELIALDAPFTIERPAALLEEVRARASRLQERLTASR